MEFGISRLLAQYRPSGTSAVTAYTKPANKLITVTHMIMCNTTAGAINVSVFYDSDGTTYDQTTALYYTYVLAANDTMFIDLDMTLEIANGTIGVQISSANAVTFSIFGQVRELV